MVSPCYPVISETQSGCSRVGYLEADGRYLLALRAGWMLYRSDDSAFQTALHITTSFLDDN